LRAGLTSLEKHGPTLLEGQSPLLRETLLAMTGELAKTPDSAFLSGELVFKLAESAIGAVAGKPELLKGNLKKEWFRDLVGSLAKTLSAQGIRETFTREGLESVVKVALGVLADHPELLGDKPGVHLELVNAVLKAVSAADSLDAKTIATAALSSALGTMATHPELVDSPYGEIIAGFTEQVAKLVAGRRGYICDACAAEAHRIMSEWDPTAPTPPQSSSIGARITRWFGRLTSVGTAERRRSQNARIA